MKGREESFMPLTDAARKRYAAYKKTGRKFTEPPLMELVTWFNENGRDLRDAPLSLVSNAWKYATDRIALLSAKKRQTTLRRVQLRWLRRWERLTDAEIARQAGAE